MTSDPTPETAAGPIAATGAPVRVLLVDDQPMVGAAFKLMVAGEDDIELLFCSEPLKALELARRFRPSVILQDLVMPDISGLALLRFFRASPATASVPMVILSSTDDPNVKAQAFAAGADDYLVKLPERVEMLARLRYHSRTFRLLQERDTALKALEDTVSHLERERERSEALLLNVLPAAIAARLKDSPQTIADQFPDVTVLFADLVGFTDFASQRTPVEVVHVLNTVFSEFDALVQRRKLEKIKTIGDAYMVVSGLPDPRPDHVVAIAELALEMRTTLEQLNRREGWSLKLRIGFHTGPVVAGIIGSSKFSYDLWGDTVNIASRLESHGMPNDIQFSTRSHRALEGAFDLVYRGEVNLKGKGPTPTWLLNGRLAG